MPLNFLVCSLNDFLHTDLPNLDNWFTLQEVSHKRRHIASVVRGMAEKQHKEEIMWPIIPFGPKTVKKKK